MIDCYPPSNFLFKFVYICVGTCCTKKEDILGKENTVYPGGHVHLHRRLLTALDSALCTLCASFRVTCHYHQHNLMIVILFIISTEIESLVESLFLEEEEE